MATALDDSAPRAERLKAAKALATSKDPLAIDTLVRMLTTMDEELRAAAVASLKALKAGPTFEARLVDRDVPAQKRTEAALGLRHLKLESSVGPLAAALEDKSAEVRKEAALALSMLNPAGAEAALIAALADADKDVRYYAADALGLVKTPKAKEAVKARLAVEPNPTVQYALSVAKDKQER
jgi:HEAT repeat protein